MTTPTRHSPRQTSFALERMFVQLASGQAPAAVYADTLPSAVHGADDVISRALLEAGVMDKSFASRDGRPGPDDPEPATVDRSVGGPSGLSGGATAPPSVYELPEAAMPVNQGRSNGLSREPRGEDRCHGTASSEEAFRHLTRHAPAL